MNNDLISRERLKNTILLGNYDTQSKILSAINNAPTVDIKDELAGAYNEGYMCGSREAEKARPQGEWENDSDNLPICNKCGEIALQRIFVKMPHLIQDVRMVRSNYCPNCGADMRSNKKETTFNDYLKEQLKDPEFRKEYEKLCDEENQKGGKE